MACSDLERRPCRLCLGPTDVGHRGWCAACNRALTVHFEMMLLVQAHAEEAARRARDPARLARIARYEDRAALALPLFR